MAIYDVQGNEVYVGSYPLGLHTNPESAGVLNVIKRARQLADVKWTPVIDLPRFCGLEIVNNGIRNFNGIFKAGVEYTGVPYCRSDHSSETGYSDSCIGLFVPIDAFVTSIENEHSYVCEVSAYDEANHNAIKYGCVCSQLVDYALGFDTYYTTEQIPLLNTMTQITTLTGNTDLTVLKLGDVLFKSGIHIAIITDIVTDSEGNVTDIEVSEATPEGNTNPSIEGSQYGGLARRKGWNVASGEFIGHWNGYSVHRYQNIATVDYGPNPYVRVGDELEMINNHDLPLIPYFGDRFPYKQGYTESGKIVINTNYYSTLKVYKDGSLFNTFTVNGASYVNTNFSDVGSYSAYLCNLSGSTEVAKSKTVYWTVEA